MPTARPVLNRPALKKYGLLRPDFSVNSPKRSTPRSRQRRMKSDGCMVRVLYTARPMRIITLNANGIRSAARKGFFDWLERQDADVVCVQETKCQREQISDPRFHPAGYHCYYFDAVKKGYSGVAVYSRVKPQTVVAGYGSREFDSEGRY